jgi:hypothetical protein
VRTTTPAGRLGLLTALALVGALLIALPASAADRPGRAVAPNAPAKALVKKAAKRKPIARAALCAAPAMSGDWHNITSTNAMTRVVVDFTCNDVILCDQYGNCSGGDSYYSMRPFGKCYPTDCNWGRLRAYDMGDGWIRSIYNFGFKTSHVWLKTYNYWGLTYLRVWVFNDFTPADGRTDYTTDEWMLR